MIDTKDKEIERLKEELNDEIDDELKQSEIMVKKQEEIERLNNIIKEVREYINKIPTQPVIRVFKKELLEILDKVRE